MKRMNSRTAELFLTNLKQKQRVYFFAVLKQEKQIEWRIL